MHGGVSVHRTECAGGVSVHRTECGGGVSVHGSVTGGMRVHGGDCAERGRCGRAEPLPRAPGAAGARRPGRGSTGAASPPLAPGPQRPRSGLGGSAQEAPGASRDPRRPPRAQEEAQRDGVAPGPGPHPAEPPADASGGCAVRPRGHTRAHRLGRTHGHAHTLTRSHSHSRGHTQGHTFAARQVHTRCHVTPGAALSPGAQGVLGTRTPDPPPQGVGGPGSIAPTRGGGDLGTQPRPPRPPLRVWPGSAPFLGVT